MNFKSYIDAIKYKKMGNESCYHWRLVFFGFRRKVEYQVLVNGKLMKFDIQRLQKRCHTKNGEISARLSCKILYDHSSKSRSRSSKALGALCCKRNEKEDCVIE